ncbi:hemerythrin domain-containing protein [Sulfitobacter sp. TSTF-M16]|uniref:Hemerythrin domain-containing protein n=2 Tax=Sulfitobacter aestuariivivens TaxID=2766981 RepID=A0A927D358_9RHOB|nr:hemerythrin domain-containing protein [Sulfitobacter aestuariivivens]
MRILLEQIPRESWAAHPGFKQATKNWLGAHQMFRRLAETLRLDAERVLDGNADKRRYAERLSYYGDALVRNLHGHHHFEDTSYFPELGAADPRFVAGLEILETDHEVLDTILDSFVRNANLVLTSDTAGADDFRNRVGAVHRSALTIEQLLARHLADEEELAVPIILHHRLRG